MTFAHTHTHTAVIATSTHRILPGTIQNSDKTAHFELSGMQKEKDSQNFESLHNPNETLTNYSLNLAETTVRIYLPSRALSAGSRGPPWRAVRLSRPPVCSSPARCSRPPRRPSRPRPQPLQLPLPHPPLPRHERIVGGWFFCSQCQYGWEICWKFPQILFRSFGSFCRWCCGAQCVVTCVTLSKFSCGTMSSPANNQMNSKQDIMTYFPCNAIHAFPAIPF